MTGRPQDQHVFDAIKQAIDTHAPQLAPDVRIATDAALKLAGVEHTVADADADAPQRLSRRTQR